jgi:hypothetical protein
LPGREAARNGHYKGIGLLISAISRSYQQAQALNLLFLLLGFLLSDRFSPIESMRQPLQYVKIEKSVL